MIDLRKVQKTGGSTLIISIPKRWAQSTGINSGDTLALVPGERNTLIIDPNPSEKGVERHKSITIDDDDPEHFFRRLIAIYINGYDTIEVNATPTMTPEMRAAIRKFTRMVIGPEITEEDLNSVQMKDLSDSAGFGMKSVVRRIFRISYSMLHDSLNAAKLGDQEIARDVVSRDAEVDRLYWLLFKQYNHMLKKPSYQKDQPEAEESLNFFLVGRILERIADHARNISRNVMNIGTKRKKSQLSPATLKVFGEAGELALSMVDGSFESFLKKDETQANLIIDQTTNLKELYSMGVSTIGGTKAEVSIAIAGIMDSVKRAGMYAADIAEISINNVENSE